jgi:hypothetical protein
MRKTSGTTKKGNRSKGKQRARNRRNRRS